MSATSLHSLVTRRYTPAPTAPAGGYSSYTPLPVGPVRHPSYKPLPAVPPSVPSYTPMPTALQQGVPSHTPVPATARQLLPNRSFSALNQTQNATPRYAPPTAEQAQATRATAEDKTVAFMPYFAIKDAEKFFEVCNRCIEQVRSESLCLGYGFSVSAGPHENMAFCREAFLNAEGVIAHLHNIEVLFKEGLCKYGELLSLQIHGPKDQLDILREEPIIQELRAEFYELMPGSFEVIELPMQQLPEVQVPQAPVEVQGRFTPVMPVRQTQARVIGGGLAEPSAVILAPERCKSSGEAVRQLVAEQSSVSIMATPTTYQTPPGTYLR